MRSLAIITLVLASSSCSNFEGSHYDPEHVDVANLVMFKDVELASIEIEGTRELKKKISSMLTPEAPIVHELWTCGLGYIEEQPKKPLDFTIVGVTEKFVPLTGKKETIYHVRMK